MGDCVRGSIVGAVGGRIMGGGTRDGRACGTGAGEWRAEEVGGTGCIDRIGGGAAGRADARMGGGGSRCEGGPAVAPRGTGGMPEAAGGGSGGGGRSPGYRGAPGATGGGATDSRCDGNGVRDAPP
jgi:hypothetical protein